MKVPAKMSRLMCVENRLVSIKCEKFALVHWHPNMAILMSRDQIYDNTKLLQLYIF